MKRAATAQEEGRMHGIGQWLAGLWPRRIAAVVVIVTAAWSLRGMADPKLLQVLLRSPAFLAALVVAGLQVLAAIGLWKRWRWAWWATLLLQLAPPAAGLLFAPRLLATLAWWLQQLPYAVVIVLLLLPESRRSRAALRERGFEPGDTMPVSSTLR
jgi:hypothetical protein